MPDSRVWPDGGLVVSLRLTHGFILTLIAGSATGLSILPIKWARRWRWENFWLLYTVVSLLIVPGALAFMACPNLLAAYASLPLHTFVRPLVFGALWGFAYLGAGLCAHRLGFALQGALIGGVGTAVGTLVPLIMQHAHMVFQVNGLLILGGTGITLCGVALCGWAGYHRERLSNQRGEGAGFSPRATAMSQAKPTRKSYILMVGVAVLSGLLAAFMNLALAYGELITGRVREAGAAPQWAPFAVWPVAFLGGSTVNLVYTLFLLSRNKTWHNFRGGTREILNPVLSACLWSGGVSLYSSATTYLGILGVSIGFGLFFVVLMLAGQMVGLFTGEWRQVPSTIYSKFALGIAFLFLAVFTFGVANYFST
jgi:L-rhamnose-H+ transport protein